MKRYFEIFVSYVALLIIPVLCPMQTNAQHVTQSVLNNGNWWKIEITTTGIYRLTPVMASSLSGCSIQDLAIYGHCGGPLSIHNGDQRIDDLEEIAIDIHDVNGDGLFNNQDYLLFYATGADCWTYDASLQYYHHTPHPYSAANYLFLTAQSGEHKRVSTVDIQAASNETVTTCHYLDLHDNDLTNTAKTGQIWVGERFYGGSTQHTFTFSLPATPIGNILVRYGLASISSSSSNFNVSLNGQTRTHTFASRTKYNTFSTEFPSNGSSIIDITIDYQYNDNLANGYLDFIEIDAVVPISTTGNSTIIHVDNIDSAIHEHQAICNDDNMRIWDITFFNQTNEIKTHKNGDRLIYNNLTDIRRSYILFNELGVSMPESVTPIANQNIHGTPIPDMIIVCHRDLHNEAIRLASIHSLYDDLDVLVVDQDQVFNEFSSGQTDPIAIREMLRMFWLRATNEERDTPRYLLLFGKGTYDNKDLLSLGLPTVVTYETPTSFDNDYSYASDDFFTFLEDSESGTIYESMDIAVGRIPAKTSDEANHMIDKIERYITRSDLMQDDIRGDWRNVVALLSDDADPSSSGDTIFTRSSEITADLILEKYPQYTIDKIYADAYVQQSGADGSYYPDVNNALEKRINYGCLLLNYIGHGSSQYIGTERFMMKSDISNYSNYRQLPFFITSTCTFGRFDDPAETCGAEEFLLAEGAGIGCLAASRPISHIQVVNTEMVMQSLNPTNTIGDAIRIAKNKRPTTLALTLIGDPALRLSFPQYRVVVTSINGNPVDSLHADSAMVLSTVTVEGEIQDNEGHLVSDFDGTIYPEVYDRPITTHTLANDNEGCEVSFTQQNSLLYKGRTNVAGGKFSYHFTVPRDVSYKYGQAKLCHYAKSATEDACGAYMNLYLGGFDESVSLDECRPEIRLFLNDTNFRNGGITDPNPTIVAILYDSVGINAVGSGLGHDITVTIDDSPNNMIVLNDLYETDIDDEHRGYIRYKMTGLSNGKHIITLKAWNIYNYSNSASLTFYVHSRDTIHTNFIANPNPSSERVWLSMEHNIKGAVTNATLQIFDMRGCCVKTITPTINNDNYMIGPIEWDLKTDSGRRVSPGIFVARFLITTADGEKLTEHGKVIVK